MDLFLFILSFIVAFVIIFIYKRTANRSNSKINTSKSKYVLSESSNTFHRPNCPYVRKIDSLNLNTNHNSYSTLISIGCKPCKKCKPQ